MVAEAAGSEQTRRQAKKRWQHGAENRLDMVAKWFENGSKVAPKRLRNVPRWPLGGLRAALGRPWDPWWALEGYKIGPGSLFEASGGKIKLSVRARGRPGQILERGFRPPGAPKSGILKQQLLPLAATEVASQLPLHIEDLLTWLAI